MAAIPFLYSWTFAFVPVQCKHNLNVTTILDTIVQRHQFTGHHLLKAVATTHANVYLQEEQKDNREVLLEWIDFSRLLMYCINK